MKDVEFAACEGIPKTTDDKWYGVPPKGERPLPGKWRFVAEIFAVILIEFVLWGIYRSVSAPLISPFGSMKFYIAHIIAAPTIHLIPIVLYWKLYRKEKGHPFTFTGTRVMSGVMIGLLSAVIWRVLEMFTYDTLSGFAGGSDLGTLGFYSLLDSTTVFLFCIMTFTHFFIVGPVEELQFRGFTQDQAARVLPNWQALTFASILFGLSHVPIAITVYKMPIDQLIVAEIGWMTAGAVFGALYMWSRNIFAAIVMHGMGNWQLSVFHFQSRMKFPGMSTMTDVVVGTLTSLIVNAAMIAIFYLIFKYYWEPQRKQNAPLKRPLQGVQRAIFRRDYGSESAGTTSISLVVFCILVCGLIMGATFALGETDFSRMLPLPKGISGETVDLSSYISTEEIQNGDGYLSERGVDIITLVSEENRYIRAVTVTVTWTDEDDIQRIRTYENDPDTFSVNVLGPNATAGETGSNPKGGEGSISASVSLTNEEISDIILEEEGNYTVEVLIVLDEVGNYFAGTGARRVGFNDAGNAYEYEMEIVWLVPEPV